MKIAAARSDNYVPSFVPLPNDAEVAPFQLPNLRRDAVEVRKQMIEIVTTTLGVPLGVISSMGVASIVKTSERIETTFNVTCRNYARIVETVLEKIFRENFEDSKDEGLVEVSLPGVDEPREEKK